MIRFSERWPNAQLLAKHLQAAHIQPWRDAAKRFGLLERRFVAHTATDARAV